MGSCSLSAVSLATGTSSQVDHRSSGDGRRGPTNSIGRSLTWPMPQSDETRSGRSSEIRKDNEQGHMGIRSESDPDEPESISASDKCASGTDSKADIPG